MGDPHATLRTGQSRPTSFPITRATDPLRAAGSSKRARGAAGLLLGAWGLDAIVASNPEPTAYWVDMRIDGRVLAFVVALMGVTTIATGRVTCTCAQSHAAATTSVHPAGRRGPHDGSGVRLTCPSRERAGQR